MGAPWNRIRSEHRCRFRNLSVERRGTKCPLLISRLATHEKDLVREVVESIIIRHDANRWFKNEKAG